MNRSPLSAGFALVFAFCVWFASGHSSPAASGELSGVEPLTAQTTPEFRALWVDAWGIGFRNASEVTQMINYAKNNNYNAIIPQVRRRGDCYYFPTAPNTEPRATNIAWNFDPLQTMITQGKANGIEVHAWIPVFLVGGTTAPTNPNHVMNARPDLLMKNSTGATQIGEGYYLDPGHPDALQWTRNVVMDLVTNYDLDGFHFDYIRYPVENSGYNETAIARYNAEFGLTGQPAANNAQFKDWRRRQITDWLRVMYVDIVAVKPHVKVTASVFGSETDAYNARMQDWAYWMSENMLDALCPMIYSPDNDSVYNPRTSNANAKKGQRHCYIGQGAYMNTIANTVTQMQYARSVGADGINTYSYRWTNSEEKSRDEFFASVKANLFPQAAPVPPMPWKTNPTGGYLRGRVIRATDGQPVYNATVILYGLGKTVRTGPDGKYAFIYVNAGNYAAAAAADGYYTSTNINVPIAAGNVTTIDFALGMEPTPTPSPTPSPSYDIIVDNDDGAPAYTETGSWWTSSGTGYIGLTFRYATSGAAHTATWTAFLGAGDFDVSAIYRTGANRPTSARYIVSTAAGPQVVFANQQLSNLEWVKLGTFAMNHGYNTVTLDAAGSSPSGMATIADAIWFKLAAPLPTPTLTPSPTPSPTPTPTPLPFTLADLVALLLGMETDLSPDVLEALDPNGDGGLAIGDVLLMLTH